MTHIRSGQIIKAHGYKGEVQVDIFLESPEVLENLESVFVEINQKLVPFFIEEIRIGEKRAIIKFEDVDTEEDARFLLKKNILISSDIIGEDESDDLIAYNALVGFKVVDKNKGELGVIEDFIERPGQDLLIMKYQEKEIFIPVDENIILKMQPRKKVLQVNLPEGLLEL